MNHTVLKVGDIFTFGYKDEKGKLATYEVVHVTQDKNLCDIKHNNSGYIYTAYSMTLLVNSSAFELLKKENCNNHPLTKIFV